MSDLEFHADNIVVDYKDYRKAFVIRTILDWRPKVFVCVCYLILLSIMQFFDPSTFSYVHVIAALLGCLALIVFITFVGIVCIIFSAHCIKKDDAFHLPYSVTSQDEGFKVESERGSTLFKWSDFKSYFETKDVIALQNKTRIYMLFGKKYFDTASLDNFKTALKENI